MYIGCKNTKRIIVLIIYPVSQYEIIGIRIFNFTINLIKERIETRYLDMVLKLKLF